MRHWSLFTQDEGNKENIVMHSADVQVVESGSATASDKASNEEEFEQLQEQQVSETANENNKEVSSIETNTVENVDGHPVISMIINKTPW